MDSDESISQETETIFEAEEFESSDDAPMNEWSSLDLNIPEDNQKKKLYARGLYDPGSGEICTKHISMSQTSILQHSLFNYPAVTDPGLKQALFSPEKPIIYSADGQDLYMATCKEMGQIPVRPFHRDLFTDTIDLSYYCVDPNGVRAMAMAITDNNMVKVLNLTDNFLNDDACYHLGEMLIYNTTLQELNMSRCRIKSTGVQRLLKGIARNTTLKKLNLNRNELGDDGAEYVAKAIREVFNVEELHLSYNNICARGTSALAEAFETPSNLVKLDLSWNSLVASDPTYCMLSKLGESDTLQEIDLSWNALAGIRIGTAIKLLIKAPNLRHLNLSNNALAGEAVTSFMGNIGKARNLITLDLSFNPLSPSDALSVLIKNKSAMVRIKNLLMEDIRVTSEFLELLREVKDMESKKDLFVAHGGVISSFKTVGPDMRELVLKRAEYLTRKSKKNHVDFALVILKLFEDVKLMTLKDFIHHIKAAGVRLDSNLIDTMVAVFEGPSTPKVKTVDLSKIADYIQRLWPDKRLPHIPLPESFPVNQPVTKEKKKKKKAKIKKTKQ